ncbi:hypothetical protein DVH24_035893 [Malus domestica]|uniref:Uncharacterized protein n=1 Tax=Malus domestica TaxID=3750 RepID=A0A498JQ07_MALDO|nr:hypothetical protein DVH24_035893 [Malus domestica]
MVLGYSPYGQLAEALVARDGLLLIVAALKNPSIDMSVIRHIIEDSEALIALVTEASSSHVRRQAIGIGHLLARTGLLSGTNCNWERVPSDLISDLLFEQAVL